MQKDWPLDRKRQGIALNWHAHRGGVDRGRHQSVTGGAISDCFWRLKKPLG
jgi:hypothetical protein